MYLKEIYMKNFKSFGQEKRVPFSPGVTAITGPNGSGKSNIGDAILFVLGPKSSKAIRAGRLPHLIFNGGKAGKAATSCKVSLIFDNSDRILPVDADQVELTRAIRLSPSEKNKDNYYSYFYINGRASKLNEFEKLLSHARISANGYNLVQQGDINQITSMSNIDRRRILDSISGISVFDKDIDRANRDKEETVHNLENVDILLNDLGNNLHRLKRERDNAIKYQEIKEEHAENEARLLKRKILNQEATIADLEEKKEKYRNDLDLLRGKIRKNTDGKFVQEKELKSIEDKLMEMGGDEAEDLRKEIDELTIGIARTEEAIRYSGDERQRHHNVIQGSKQEIRRIGKEVKAIEKEREQASVELKEREKELAKLNRDIESVRKRITSTSTKTMDIQREILLLKRGYEEKSTEFRERKLEQDRLTEKRRIRHREVDDLRDSAESLEFEVKDLDWRIGEFRKQTKDSSQKKGELERELHRILNDEKKLVKNIQDLEHRIRTAQMEYSRRKAEADAHENITHGYNQSVNLILNARDSGEIKGIIGTVAELSSVDDEYQTAISIAAGGKLQAVIVEDDETASRAINHLKRRKAGRVTFLPLNKMMAPRTRGKAIMLLKQPGIIGLALDLIDFDDRYRTAFSYVFRDTIIAKDLQVARENMGGVRIVTLEGDLIDPSGAMTGGSIRQSSLGFGGSKSEVDRLFGELQSMEERHQNLSAKLSLMREEITTVQKQLDSYRGDITGEIARLETERNKLHSRYRAQMTTVDEGTIELDSMDSAVEKGTGEVESLHRELKSMEEKVKELNEVLLRATDKNLADSINSLEREKSDLESTLKDLQARIEVFTHRLTLHNERTTTLTHDVGSAEKGITTAKANEQGLKAELTDLRQKKEARIKVQLSMSKELEGVRKERDTIFDSIKEFEKLIDQDRVRFSTFSQILDDIELKLPDIQEELLNLKEEFAERGRTVQETDLQGEEELRKLVKVLGDSMRRLEPVNMLAVKEYEALSIRRTEKKELRKRLVDQKEELEKVVTQLTEKKTRALDEIFSEVNKNFTEIYGALSNGGTAELIMENPENPFEGGLLISARPRGKKVYYLNALSGGEKSLTAIAFIFAIQRYMPSPFYYLDEVDMFLDATNAGNVAAMLKNNSKYAQIIIVSLRKVTLMNSDNLYGVTMHGKGLSDIYHHSMTYMSKESLRYIAGDDLQDDDIPDEDDGERTLSKQGKKTHGPRPRKKEGREREIISSSEEPEVGTALDSSGVDIEESGAEAGGMG